jgi:hypothetical protein
MQVLRVAMLIFRCYLLIVLVIAISMGAASYRGLCLIYETSSSRRTSFPGIKKNSPEDQRRVNLYYSGISPPMRRKVVAVGGAQDHGMFNNVAHTRALGAITLV